MYRILIVLIVLISIVLVVEPVTADECYPNEHCYTIGSLRAKNIALAVLIPWIFVICHLIQATGITTTTMRSAVHQLCLL